MDVASADPAAAMKGISGEIQQKFDEAGMGKVAEFLAQMEGVMAKAKEGPGALLQSAQEQVNGMKQKLEAGLADPSSLVGSAGGPAACVAGWYGGEVSKKLEGFGGEVSGLVETMTKMATDVSGPMQDLAEGLEAAVKQLQDSTKSLAELPKLVQDELSGKDSPDDIAKIDTSKLKEALSAGDLDGPLAAIGGTKDLLDKAIGVLKSGAETLENFLGTAPATVRGAFDMPCGLHAVLLSQAPQLMTDLLEECDKLQGISLQPLMDALAGTQETLGSSDADTVKTPVNTFLESAKDLVEKLDKTVSDAKMAASAPAVPVRPEVPAAPAVPKKKGFFGK